MCMQGEVVGMTTKPGCLQALQGAMNMNHYLHAGLSMSVSHPSHPAIDIQCSTPAVTQ